MINDISFMQAFGLEHKDLIGAINKAREQNVIGTIYLVIPQPMLEYRGHKVVIAPNFAPPDQEMPVRERVYATSENPFIADYD